MSPKIRLDMSEVLRCEKPGCKHTTIISRHHLRHEKTWINLFDRIGPPGWPILSPEPGRGRSILSRLKERYYAFRPQDIVNLCEWHHVEIHVLYAQIFYDAYQKFQKKKVQFGWREAIWCMYKCKKECRRWLKKRTTGLSPVAARQRGSWG